MKVSDYIVTFLINKGIKDVFGYPGGMVTHLIDSFTKYNDKITAHVNYHEQASAFCACGYAQATGLPGVAYATSGPGATNLVTGIANAYFDSIPCVFLTGQVNTYESKGNLSVRQKGFQETDIVSIVKPITKYAVQITSKKNIKYELEKAFFLAMHERRGPVLLDIPMNIQREDIDIDKLNEFKPVLDKKDIDIKTSNILKMLNDARRPCILVGAGIKQIGIKKSFCNLIEKLDIPVVSSMLAMDVFSYNAKNYYGFIGAYGARKANFILAKSDLIISIGSRMDCRQIGNKKENFAPSAKLIRFDIDTDEFSNKIKDDEIQILCDLNDSIMWLLKNIEIKKGKYENWNIVCNKISETLENVDVTKIGNLINKFSIEIPDNSIITTDVGQNQVWIAQYFKVKENQKIFFSGGHGAMGYSLPAAIGAQIGSKQHVFCFNGDGGIQMNIQELQFIAREELPIKIIILNNNALGMIRHFQKMYFNSNFSQTTKQGGYSVPYFKKIAMAYDIKYRYIKNIGDFTNLTFDDNPEIIEIFLPEETYLIPKLGTNMPNQDQQPLLDRKIYDFLMSL